MMGHPHANFTWTTLMGPLSKAHFPKYMVFRVQAHIFGHMNLYIILSLWLCYPSYICIFWKFPRFIMKIVFCQVFYFLLILLFLTRRDVSFIIINQHRYIGPVLRVVPRGNDRGPRFFGVPKNKRIEAIYKISFLVILDCSYLYFFLSIM